MSNSNLTAILPVVDPHLEHRDVKLINIPPSVTYREFVATSLSNQTITYICNPPSPQTFIGKTVWRSLGFNLTYSGTTSATSMMQAGYDAPRFLPIASCILSEVLNINDATISLQTNQIVPYLAQYKDTLVSRSLYSLVRDKYANYIDGVGAANNPLSTYIDSVASHQGRGAIGGIMVINTGTTASTMSGIIYEPIFMSPLDCDISVENAGLGLTGISTMSDTINLGDLTRLICHAISAGTTINSVTANITSSSLTFEYFTPPTNYVPHPVSYAHQAIQLYTSANYGSLAPNASVIATSNNIQLNSIPRSVYIFMKRSVAEDNYTTTDTFCNISNISINFDNKSGLLSQCNESGLYRIACENGYKNSWAEWHGIVPNAANLATNIGLTGSLLRLDFGKDITIAENNYVNKVGTFNFQFTATFKNINQTQTITSPTLYIITVTDGKFVTDSGKSTVTIGIDPSEGSLISYNDYQEYYGAGFSDWISKAYKNVMSFIKPVNDYLRKTHLISNVASQIPIPMAQNISTAAKQLGYGLPASADGSYGGMMSGGALTSRAELLNAIKNM